jgi:hypothetical protein
MAERGSVARETFEQVQALVADGTSLKAAFTKLSENTGRSAGTIQAAYYRHARKVGAVNERLGRPATGRKASPRASKPATTTGAPRVPRASASTNGDLARRRADAASTLQALSREISTLERDAAAWRDVKRLAAAGA